MTILRVDDETFSIIMMALNECGYDTGNLEIDFYDEIEMQDEKINTSKNQENKKKKKICVD